MVAPTQTCIFMTAVKGTWNSASLSCGPRWGQDNLSTGLWMQCSLTSLLLGQPRQGLPGSSSPAWTRNDTLLLQSTTSLGRRGRPMRLSTTTTSRPLIPVAVPEAATQACNFQTGPGPKATPLLNQSLNRSYLIISWLLGQAASPPGSSTQESAFCLACVGYWPAPSWPPHCLCPALQGSLAWRNPGPSLFAPHPQHPSSLLHQLQTFLAPSHWPNHAFLFPKGPQLGFLPDNLTICADNCRAFSHKKNGKMAQKLENVPSFFTNPQLPYHLAKCLSSAKEEMILRRTKQRLPNTSRRLFCSQVGQQAEHPILDPKPLQKRLGTWASEGLVIIP